MYLYEDMFSLTLTLRSTSLLCSNIQLKANFANYVSNTLLSCDYSIGTKLIHSSNTKEMSKFKFQYLRVIFYFIACYQFFLNY